MRCAIEPLEPRRLLSASLAAGFVGSVPRSVMPQGHAQVALRVTDAAISQGRETVRVSLFASPEPGLDAGALPLVPKPQVVHVAHGRVATARFHFSPPASIGSGDYYLVARVDSGVLRTGDESVVAVAPRTTAFVQPFVDLTAQIVQQPSQAVYVDSQHSGGGKVTVLVFNAGNAAAVGTLSASVYASSEASFKSTSPVIGQTSVPKFSLPGGKSKIISVALTIPAGTAAGSYHLFAQINASGGIVESNVNNNVASTLTPLVVTNTPPATGGYHHHHHGGMGDYGYGYGAASLVGVGVGVAVDDGSSDWMDVPTDTGSSDVPPSDGGAPPEDTTPTSEPTSPTTDPTTQPVDSSSGSGSADSSSAGGDFGSGGSVGGDFGTSNGGGDFNGPGGDGSSEFASFTRSTISTRRVSLPRPGRR